MKVLSDLETMDMLLNGYSIARFGDGEIILMFEKQIMFQKYDELLSNFLKGISSMRICHPKLLVGIPPLICEQYSGYTQECIKAWKYFNSTKKRKYFMDNIVDKNAVYASSFITRVSEICDYEPIIDKFKILWKGKKIVYLISIENRSSFQDKLDYLFSESIIKYIDIPHTNAWDNRDIIVKSVLEYDTDHLILCSCGPTATVLAYILTIFGYQCIDLGHFVNLMNFRMDKEELS